MKNWIKQFIHNCIVHPILPFIPTQFGDQLHQVNGEWAFDPED